MQNLSLSLSLLPPNPRVAKDNLPLAIVRLKNESTEMVMINGRMLLAPQGYPPKIREMVFSIAGPPGSISLKTFRVNAGAAGIEQFLRLEPGEYIDRVYELKEYFHYDVSGRYSIRAKYHNEVDYEKLADRSWKGDLESDEVYFEII